MGSVPTESFVEVTTGSGSSAVVTRVKPCEGRAYEAERGGSVNHLTFHELSTVSHSAIPLLSRSDRLNIFNIGKGIPCVRPTMRPTMVSATG